MRTIPIALLVACSTLSSCKLFRQDSGRLVVRRNGAFEAKHVDGKPDDILSGAESGIVLPKGDGMIFVSTGGALSRLSGAPIACKVAPGATPYGIDEAGNRFLFGVENRSAQNETVHFMDLGSCAETTLDVRGAYRGDVASDGSEAAIGAFPSSCTELLVNRCPITLYRLRPPGSPVPTEVIRGGKRAHYQPRYFPDDKLVFQTTELDGACDGTVNGCRHDIVSIPLHGGPSSPLTLVRRGALAPSISPDGKRIAYLAYMGAETSCGGKLPCTSSTLKVGDLSDDGRHDVDVVKGRVSNITTHAFSVDGRWVAFAVSTLATPEMCRSNGGSCKTADGRLIGWLK
ncbi:MAG TPA: hypothetical protein VGH87_13060 [Polyangiaceae bacterium]